MMVAYARALADAGGSHVPGFQDPTARVFLPPRAREYLTKMATQLVHGAADPVNTQRGLRMRLAVAHRV